MKIGRIFKKFKTGLRLLFKKDYLSLIIGLYREYYNLLFIINKSKLKLIDYNLNVEIKHKIAFNSPDYIVSWGTKRDNSTNRAFVLLINRRLGREFPKTHLKFLDLGRRR